MMRSDWSPVPLGLDADRWLTRSGCSNVLVAMHSVVSGQRLLDIVDLLETDLRVQTVYTRGPGAFGNGVDSLLGSLEAAQISWWQATHERFDLVVAAGYNGMHEIHGPIMILPHGAAYGKRAYVGNGMGGAAERQVYGLDSQRLIRDGRVVPSAVVLSHHKQREVLARQAPDVAPVGVVAGDPCYDRMLASVANRAEYRAALGIRPECELVVVTSTWGKRSLFGRDANLLPELMHEVGGGERRVAALIHPAVWYAHGPRQIRAWLAEARAAGLLLIEPYLDWRAAVLAADHVIGDFGSSTVYAAAVGVPVLHTGLPVAEVDADTPQAWLGANAPMLDRTRPVVPQLDAAAALAPALRDGVVARLTSVPGQSHRLLRQEMYRLLGMSVPGRHRGPDPIPPLVARHG
jgi:hypothetical protein